MTNGNDFKTQIAEKGKEGAERNGNDSPTGRRAEEGKEKEEKEELLTDGRGERTRLEYRTGAGERHVKNSLRRKNLKKASS